MHLKLIFFFFLKSIQIRFQNEKKIWLNQNQTTTADEFSTEMQCILNTHAPGDPWSLLTLILRIMLHEAGALDLTQRKVGCPLD